MYDILLLSLIATIILIVTHKNNVNSTKKNELKK